MSAKYAATELKSFAKRLFLHAGLSEERADVMATVFLEADLLGFTTHGFNRIPTNVEWLLSGASCKEGEPKILADRGSVFNWDADFLPGPWVLSQAIQQAMTRVKERGIVAATIRRSQHIACLAAYFPQIVEAGYVGLITCSTPAENTVCPHGGIDPVFSANPVAFAAPAEDYPLIMDISMSVTAGGYVARAKREGRKLPEPCLKDNQGNITDDPAALFSEPPGSILPLGGAGHGYKGYGLSMMTEVLSMALGGYGRSNAEATDDGEANSVFLQIIDPQAFGPMDAFKREIATMRDLCETSRVRQDDPPVRVPGKRAWLRRESQLHTGVELYPSIMDDIKPWAEKLDVALPPQL